MKDKRADVPAWFHEEFAAWALLWFHVRQSQLQQSSYATP